MGEGTNATEMTLGTLLWEELQGSTTWGFEFTVRPTCTMKIEAEFALVNEFFQLRA